METKLKRKPGRPRKFCPIQEDAYEDETEEQIHTRELMYKWREEHKEQYRAYQREYQAAWRERNRERHNEIYNTHTKRKRLHKLIEKNEQDTNKESVQ